MTILTVTNPSIPSTASMDATTRIRADVQAHAEEGTTYDPVAMRRLAPLFAVEARHRTETLLTTNGWGSFLTPEGEQQLAHQIHSGVQAHRVFCEEFMQADTALSTCPPVGRVYAAEVMAQMTKAAAVASRVRVLVHALVPPRNTLADVLRGGCGVGDEQRLITPASVLGLMDRQLVTLGNVEHHAALLACGVPVAPLMEQLRGAREPLAEAVDGNLRQRIADLRRQRDLSQMMLEQVSLEVVQLMGVALGKEASTQLRALLPTIRPKRTKEEKKEDKPDAKKAGAKPAAGGSTPASAPPTTAPASTTPAATPTPPAPVPPAVPPAPAPQGGADNNTEEPTPAGGTKAA